jgi:transcriptional regulator with XRE-family HTH domain
MNKCVRLPESKPSGGGIGAMIKKLRTRTGDSLQQVADSVGASKPHIWELESNRSVNPSLDLLKQLARHFKVSVSYLLEEHAAADALIFGHEITDLTEADKKLLLDIAKHLSGQRS